jgi:hypothetical protein
MEHRVDNIRWADATAELTDMGRVVLPGLLACDECHELIGLYGEAPAFRRRIVMASHGFGRGEYQYFAYPLPLLVRELREAMYPHLAEVANQWSEQLGMAAPYPVTLATYLDRCHAAGQTRPTPLLLKYGADDFNRLHQDVYGELVFPLQLTVLLSQPHEDFEGGEFVLVEQRPRTQSMAEVMPLTRGDAVVFTVRDHPVPGRRGFYRAVMRHGVSRVRRGERYTLGVIFHDAR